MKHNRSGLDAVALPADELFRFERLGDAHQQRSPLPPYRCTLRENRLVICGCATQWSPPRARLK
jgi:hypothetical protein